MTPLREPFSAFVFAAGAALLAAPMFALCLAGTAAAQTSPPPAASSEKPNPEKLTAKKLNAYVGCINRLSERSYESRKRYFSWAGRKGPTGRERIIYGTYTIYDTSDCRKNVENANAMEPHDAALESAGTAYVEAVSKLEPLLKEADDYYEQQDYKDDRMAKGKALHPRLVAAWDAFARADQALRGEVEAINDRRSAERLAEIEKSEGRKARYHVEALMIQAKRVLRAQNMAKPDLAAMTQALTAYEETIKSAAPFTGSALSNDKIGSMFMSNAKSYLVTAKQLMRRIRDHVPYSSGERMMLNSGGGGWMIEGSPQRLLRDYNQLIEAYNRGARI